MDSAATSVAGMNRQMPSSETCGRFAFTVLTFALSQPRAMSAGSTASHNCVRHDHVGRNREVGDFEHAGAMEHRRLDIKARRPVGAVSSTDLVTQSESALSSGTSAGKPNEPPSNTHRDAGRVPAFPAYFQVRGFHADRDGQGPDLRGDFHVGMHVVELTTGIPILDAQPVLALFRDDLEFLVVRNLESLGPPRLRPASRNSPGAAGSLGPRCVPTTQRNARISGNLAFIFVFSSDSR